MGVREVGGHRVQVPVGENICTLPEAQTCSGLEVVPLVCGFSTETGVVLEGTGRGPARAGHPQVLQALDCFLFLFFFVVLFSFPRQASP